MRIRLFVNVLAVASVGVLLAAPTASAVPIVAYWKARLHGTAVDPAIGGVAKVVETSPTDRSITVNLWRAGRFSGRRLALYVSGRFVGWMRVGSLGGAHLHSDAMPRIRIGHYGVRVRTARGVLVARGRLRLMNPP